MTSPPRSDAGLPARGASRFNRAEVVDENFVRILTELASREDGADVSGPTDAPVVVGRRMTRRDLVELFDSQMVCRHQDIEARRMRARDEGFYTIGSAGHEGNALVGRLTRHTDPAFIHYRSGAFMAERARLAGAVDFTADVMHSFAASSLDPIAGGRHKVWGSVAMNVPPQTSTIASHLPKAVGAALSIPRAKRIGATLPVPQDAIVVCSFGDASVNHAVAQTAFNAAGWSAHQKFPVPILFVCEDNGLGISVHTPPGWIEATLSRRPGIRYVRADGLNLLSGFDAVDEAVKLCRTRRCPVFLHLSVVRLLGHAGSDPETEYHSWDQIEAAERLDPLLRTAELVLEHRVLRAADVLARYEATRAKVQEAARKAAAAPKLTSAAQIIAPLAPYTPDAVLAEARRSAGDDVRARTFDGADRLPENAPPRHMAVLINQGLHDLLAKYPQAILFGEDVAKKGGVYHVTAGLHERFGAARVFNTLLDETMILGMAIGAGHAGLLPIPEIQYLAYYHNAEDQVRGEACSLQFFSNNQFRNPMVIRIAGWGYQKGFGGHFHNDNSIAALRDVPGLVVATPSRGDDAVKMMRTCVALAAIDGRVCAFLEPIALYMQKDLHESKDGGWQFAYPAPGESIPLGEGCVYHEDASDLTILTFANGVWMSLRAAKVLREQHGIAARVVDLRWLNPLNEAFILEQARATARVLVVDEGRRTGGVAEALLSLICESCNGSVLARRHNALDTYVPLGAASNLVMPTEATIVAAARDVCACAEAAGRCG